MSVIVRMEMPVCCADCPCCICLNGMKPAYCKAVMVDDDNIVDGFMWRETDPNNRPSWCPIVGELPEQHGDLIDRAWLLKFFDGINDIIDEDDVKCAQTIVPATERSDNVEPNTKWESITIKTTEKASNLWT